MIKSILKTADSKKAICYIDSVIHARKALQVQEKFSLKILYVTNKPDVQKLLHNHQCESKIFKNKIQFIYLLYSLRKLDFYFFIAACVDQIPFQCIYFLCRFSYFATIDEGIYTVDKYSRLNAEKSFSFKTHKLFFLLEKITRFPKNPLFFINNSNVHFAWFHSDLYRGTALEDKLFFMDVIKPLPSENEYRVLVGQPFKWMGLSDDNKNEILSLIDKAGINLYIRHPRENSNNSFISSVGCSIASLDGDLEDFLNNLPVTNLHVYSFMSSAIFGLRQEVTIHLLKLTLADGQQANFDRFTKMLDTSMIKYHIT